MNKNLKISQEKKINLIFQYIFNSEKHIEEEEFWNKLSKNDIKELKEIENEKTISLDELKASL